MAGDIKELLIQPFQFYQVNYIRDNKEVTELWPIILLICLKDKKHVH